MTRTPAQALTDQLREADREVVALGALGWHSMPHGSPEREMFRTKLEAAARISQALGNLGVKPPPVDVMTFRRVGDKGPEVVVPLKGEGFIPDWYSNWYPKGGQITPPRQQQLKPPPTYCAGRDRNGQHYRHFAAKDSAYCRYHSGQQVTDHEQAEKWAAAIRGMLADLGHTRTTPLPRWRRWLIRLLAR